jgi:protein-S-isoprenylcysteine O-methyltransferase Ste14
MASAAEVRPDTVLVTGGAFGVVRHPLYLSVLLLWAGGALSLLSWAMAGAWLLLVPAFVARARVEERLLGRHFGEGYGAYAARVPMLLPGFRGR